MSLIDDTRDSRQTIEFPHINKITFQKRNLTRCTCVERRKKKFKKNVCVYAVLFFYQLFSLSSHTLRIECVETNPWKQIIIQFCFNVLFFVILFVCHIIHLCFFFSPFVTQCFLHCIWITTACVCESMFVISFPYLVKKIKRFAFLFQLFKCMRECNNHTINTHRWIHT